MTDIGEYLVGAYLQLIRGCNFVGYNIRSPEKGQKEQYELDVVGIDFNSKTVFLCEATTHIKGTLYKDNETTVERINNKHEYQKAYYNAYLSNFSNVHFMLWSPYVPKGKITEELLKLTQLELIINENYTKNINQLIDLAKNESKDFGNPAFRLYRLLGI